MIKKICLTILLCSLLTPFFAYVPATFASVTTSTISVGTQALFAKDIPIDLAVQTADPVTQVRVQWIIPYGLHSGFGDKMAYNTNLVPGNTLSDHIVIIPDFPGQYPVTATISGIDNGQPFSESATAYITIDANLGLVQNGVSHTLHLVIYILVSIICLGVFVFLIRGLYNELRVRFYHWLNRES